MEPFEQYEHAGCVISFHYDEYAGDPRREYDHNGVMRCKHGRYELGDVQASADTWEELLEEARDDGALEPILPLYLIDHSGLAMRTGPFHEDPGGWDSGRVGVIYATRETLLAGGHDPENLPSSEQLAEWLTAEVAEYSAYLEGDVFCWTVERGGEIIESCCGYYDYCANEDYVKRECEAIAEREDKSSQQLAAYTYAH